MGRFAEVDARGIGSGKSQSNTDAPVQNTRRADDFVQRQAIGVAGEQALREHYEKRGWTVSCPVRNNSNHLVRAEPGFLICGEGRTGLDRRFIPLAGANEWVSNNCTPAFFGNRHAVIAPDLRLDKPGQAPRLVEVKTTPWVRQAHGVFGGKVLYGSGVVGWRQPYAESYELLAQLGAPVEICLIAFGRWAGAKSPSKASRSWGLYRFRYMALLHGWLPSPVARSRGARFLRVGQASRASKESCEAVCARSVELIELAGADPFGTRIGSDAYA